MRLLCSKICQLFYSAIPEKMSQLFFRFYPIILKKCSLACTFHYESGFKCNNYESDVYTHKKPKKKKIVDHTVSVVIPPQNQIQLSLRLPLLLTTPLLALDSGHYSPSHPVYSSIMPDSRSFLLFHAGIIALPLSSIDYLWVSLVPRPHPL